MPFHTEAQYSSALTRSDEQYSVSPDIKCGTNNSGSKFPKRGWSVSKYSDIHLAAVALSIFTPVQDRISRSCRRGSHISGMGVEVSFRALLVTRRLARIDEELEDCSVLGPFSFVDRLLLPFSFRVISKCGRLSYSTYEKGVKSRYDSCSAEIGSGGGVTGYAIGFWASKSNGDDALLVPGTELAGSLDSVSSLRTESTTYALVSDLRDTRSRVASSGGRLLSISTISRTILFAPSGNSGPPSL